MAAPTRKQLAAAQRRTLTTMRKRLLDMAAQWDEIDQYNMNELESAADKLTEVGKGMIDEGAEEA